MWRALLAKDLRRAWRNPIPWLINLALPLCITGLIGLIFGGQSESGLGRIRFAVVDEDDSPLTQMLRGGMNQGQGGKYLEPVFLDRADALRQITNNAISAALIIPTNFTRNYLRGEALVKLELIKNPAQSIHPTVLEELLGVVVTGLNALARNFQSEFPAWREVFENEFDYHRVSALIEQTGRKFEAAKQYLAPPLVIYEKVSGEEDKQPTVHSPTSTVAGPESTVQSSQSAAQGPKSEVQNARAQPGEAVAKPGSASASSNSEAKTNGKKRADSAKPKKETASRIFAYLLLGMCAMFLLFIAANALSDLLRELRMRTFERYQTIRHRLMPFVLSKFLFALVLLLFAAAVMLGLGGLIFRVQWHQPGLLGLLVLAYGCFATALMALFVALMPDERRAGAITNVAGMLLGIAGGCMFPREQLPRFLSQQVTPLLPSGWFVEAARALQFGEHVSWAAVALKFAAVSLVLLASAVWVFQRRFRRGVRA